MKRSAEGKNAKLGHMLFQVLPAGPFPPLRVPKFARATVQSPNPMRCIPLAGASAMGSITIFFTCHARVIATALTTL
jgi:hypothetical protein